MISQVESKLKQAYVIFYNLYFSWNYIGQRNKASEKENLPHCETQMEVFHLFPRYTPNTKHCAAKV